MVFFPRNIGAITLRGFRSAGSNRCTLTFCDQTNYLCPPYAYLVEMPDYPQVKVEGLTVEARAKNLAMLRRIAELAHEYAIDFDLGIWMQAPVPKYSGAVKVTGLPEGQASAEYCAPGPAAHLRSVPADRRPAIAHE